MSIILNYVIEHVHNLANNIAHCRRLLKPGGTLIVVAPNIESLGRRYFGVDWRGLAPPRNIHTFSSKTL